MWEEDARGERDLVGRATVEPSRFDLNGFNGEVPLQAEGDVTRGYLKVKVKMDAHPYPPDGLQGFDVTVDKSHRLRSWGLLLDGLDGRTLYVIAVENGPVALYNKTQHPESQLAPGTFILKVNDVEGNSRKLTEALQKAKRVSLVVRRPEEMRVAIGPGRLLGVNVPKYPAGFSLLITRVGAGAVQNWNAENPCQEVKVRDRIVAINGKTGKAVELQNMIKDSLSIGFQMTVVRPANKE